MKRELLLVLCGAPFGWMSHVLWAEATPRAADQFPSRPLLDALAFVESSNNPRAVSRAGARGLYQFMPATWGDMMDEPFSRAFEPALCELAAVRYLEWLKATLTKWRGSPPDVIDILACWHGGIGRYRARGYDLAAMPTSTKMFVAKVVSRMRTPNN